MYLGRALRTKETLPDFRKRCRVTQLSRIFRGLTGSQRTTRIWGVTLPPLKRISSSKFISDSKSYGYCALIVASGSQVASSLPWCCQSTFINGTCLFHNCFTSRARMVFGSSSYDKSSCTCISCTGSICDSSERYLKYRHMKHIV